MSLLIVINHRGHMKKSSPVALIVLVSALASVLNCAHAQTKPTDTKSATPKVDAAKSTAALAPVEAVTIKAGLWEMTNEISTGASSKAPPKTIAHSLNCFIPADANFPQRLIPQQVEAGMNCEAQNYKLKKNVASWRLVCKGKAGSLSGAGEMLIQNDSYIGTVKVQKTAGGKVSSATQKISGKWREASACK